MRTEHYQTCSLCEVEYRLNTQNIPPEWRRMQIRKGNGYHVKTLFICPYCKVFVDSIFAAFQERLNTGHPRLDKVLLERNK